MSLSVFAVNLAVLVRSLARTEMWGSTVNYCASKE